MALKTPDTEAVLGCHHCHTILDLKIYDHERYDAAFEKAKKRTLAYWKLKGLM